MQQVSDAFYKTELKQEVAAIKA